jgi:hypothetical protein
MQPFYFNYTSVFDVMNIIDEKHFKTFLEKIKNAHKLKAENTIEKIEKSNVINEQQENCGYSKEFIQ